MKRAAPPSETIGGAGGVINGKFYLAGPDSQLHVYDPISNTWATKASMSESRHSMVAAVLNGKLYLISSQQGWLEFPYPDLDVYDPVTDAWMVKTPLPFGTVGGAAVNAGGRIYYIAGQISALYAESVPGVSEVYAYTP